MQPILQTHADYTNTQFLNRLQTFQQRSLTVSCANNHAQRFIILLVVITSLQLIL